MPLFKQSIWRNIWKKSNKCNQWFLPGKRFEETFNDAQWRKVKQMQPMRLCIFSGKLFEETFENAQCRKVKRIQPMWLCICSGRQFNACLDPSSLRKHLITDNKEKSKQMWLCLFRSKLFEETFESAQCRKVKQMQPMQLSICSGRQFEVTSENAQFKNSNKPLKTHCRKIKKCYRCDLFGQAILGHIRKRTVEKNQTNATKVTLPVKIQALWGNIW